MQAVFPGQTTVDRTTMNFWEDTRVVKAVQKTGRKKVVIAALWTEVCLAIAALSALDDGYEVYFVSDASAEVTKEAHEMAIQRMFQAGAVPHDLAPGEARMAARLGAPGHVCCRHRRGQRARWGVRPGASMTPKPCWVSTPVTQARRRSNLPPKRPGGKGGSGREARRMNEVRHVLLPALACRSGQKGAMYVS